MQRLIGLLVFVLFGCGLAYGAEPVASQAGNCPSHGDRLKHHKCIL